MKKKQKKVIVAKKDKDHPSATHHLTSGNKSFRDKSDSYSFSATSSKKSTPNASNLSSFVEKSDGDFSKLMSSNYHEKMKNVRERDLISTMNLSVRPKTTAQLFPNQNPLLSKTLSSTVKTSNPSIPRVCFTNIQRIQNNKTQLVKKSSGRDTPENLKKRFANTGDLNKIKLIYKQITTSSSLDTTNENNAFMFNQEGTIPIYNSAGNLNQNMNTLNDSDLTDESYFDSENPGNRKTRKVKKSLFYYHHEKDENGLISMKKYRKSDYTSASCSDSENPGQRKKKFIKKSNCIYATIPNPSNPKEKITKKFNRDEYTSESCSNPENPNKRIKKYVKKSEFLYETVFVPDPDNPSHTHKIIQKTKLNDPKFVFEEYSDPNNPGKKKLRKLNKEEFTSEEYSDPDHPNQMKKRFVKKDKFFYETINDPNDPTKKKVIKTKLDDPKFVFEEYSDPNNPGEKKLRKMNREDFTSEEYSDPDHPNQMKKRFVKKNEFFYETINDPNDPNKKIIQKTKLNDPRFIFDEYSDPNNPGKKKLRKLNKEEFTSEEYSDPDHPNQMKKRFVKKNEFFYETINDPNDPTKKKVIKTKLDDPKFVFEEYSDPENPGKKKLRKMNREDFTSEEYSDPDHPNQMKKRFVKKNEFFYRKISHPNNPTQKIIQKVRLNDPKFFFETVPDPKNPGKTKVLCFEIGIDCELESYSDPENPGQRKQQIKKLLNPKFQKYQKFTKINKETNTNTKKAKDFSIEKDKDQVDLNIQPPPLPLRLLPLCDAFAQTSPKPKHIFIKTTVDIPKRPETPKANPPHIRFENDGMIDTFHAVYTKIMPHTTCEIPPDPNFPPTRRGYKNNLSIPNNFSTPSSMRNITRTTIANVESRITKKPAMTFGATPGTISISKSPYSQNTMKTRNGIEFDSPDFDFDSFENQPSFLSFAGLTKFEHMNRVIKNMATHANEKSKQQPSRSQQNPHNVSPRRRTPKP